MVLFSPISFTRAPHHNLACSKLLYSFFIRKGNELWEMTAEELCTSSVGIMYLSPPYVRVENSYYGLDEIVLPGFMDLLDVLSTSCTSGEDHSVSPGWGNL